MFAGKWIKSSRFYMYWHCLEVAFYSSEDFMRNKFLVSFKYQLSLACFSKKLNKDNCWKSLKRIDCRSTILWIWVYLFANLTNLSSVCVTVAYFLWVCQCILHPVKLDCGWVKSDAGFCGARNHLCIIYYAPNNLVRPPLHLKH